MISKREEDLMKKILFALTAVITAIGLCACGGASYNSSGSYYAAESKEAAAAEAAYDYDGAFYEETVTEAEAPASAASGSASSPQYSGDVKLIYRANISAETTDLDQAASEVEKLTAELGGYIESSSIQTENYGSGTYRYAYYTVRVPSENYETFLSSVNASGACSVTGTSRSTTDVGTEYADTEAHLNTLKIKQERLQALLEEAKKMEDIIELESALSDVEYEIEWYSSDLNRYDSLIGFSTITLDIREVTRETAVTQTSGFGDRVGSAFSNGLSAVAGFFEGLVIFLAYAWLPLVIIAAIVILIIVLVKKHAKKNAAKRAQAGPMPDEYTE